MKCCCGKYDLTEPLTINTTTHEPLGPEGNFCGPDYKHHMRDMQDTIDRLTSELAAAREEAQKWESIGRWTEHQRLQIQALIEEVANAHAAGVAEGMERVPIGWQLCPKCQGQGVVAYPPNYPAGFGGYTSQTSWTCDVCNGAKIIAIRTASPEPSVCEWTAKGGLHDTSCGEEAPYALGFKFCPFCNRSIKVSNTPE